MFVFRSSFGTLLPKYAIHQHDYIASSSTSRCVGPPLLHINHVSPALFITIPQRQETYKIGDLVGGLATARGRSALYTYEPLPFKHHCCVTYEAGALSSIISTARANVLPFVIGTTAAREREARPRAVKKRVVNCILFAGIGVSIMWMLKTSVEDD